MSDHEFSRVTARITGRIGWVILVLLSGYYLYRAVHYRLVIPDRLGWLSWWPLFSGSRSRPSRRAEA